MTLFPKSFFHLNGGGSALRLRVPGWARTPIQMKKTFWKYFECENSFCTRSRNLFWVGAGFSFQWLNFSKNAWNFALFEIWSGCRYDMKIIFGVFDNLDAKLLSNKIFWCWHTWSIDSGSVYFISECQGPDINFGTWGQLFENENFKPMIVKCSQWIL